jgi:Ca2+-transporting ATPase
VSGVGQLVVTNVGDDTMIGQIARRLVGDPGEIAPQADGAVETPQSREERIQQKLTFSKQSTPLQEKLEVLARLISKIGYTAAIAIFFALLVRGLWIGEIRWSEPGEETKTVLLSSVKYLLSYFVYLVIIIVVTVPEGLPMSVTVSLAIAWRRMSKANSLVRQLVACETIGSATVICTDKTGTLTQNKMTVSRIGLAGKTFETSPIDIGMSTGGEPIAGTPLYWLIINAAVNSTASLERKNDQLLTVGNSTEGALLNWLQEGAWIRSDRPLNYLELRASYPVLYQIHFTSDRKRMTTLAKVGDRPMTLVKGAPEFILTECKKYLDVNGTVRNLTAEIRATLHAQLAAAAGDAMRTLAFAHVELPPDTPQDEESIQLLREGTLEGEKQDGKTILDPLEQGLIFTGFVGIRDPLRDDVKEAVQQCRLAGIEVKMITGDTIATARAIGREIGLIDSPDSIALTSAEFNALTDDEVKEKLPHIRILARALPKDKFRLVGLLQEQKHVVAMTGDGTNDAPALKRADVGLSMGIAGTEVAKEASKIVLLDDSFTTIVRAVHWGRSLYENIQRFIQFQLTINVSALVIAFLGPLLGLRPPFTVLQLLWINVIMDTFAAMALCSEPPRENLMRKPPKKRNENILTREMLLNIFVTASFFVVVMIGLLLGMKHFELFAGEGPHARDLQLTVRQVTIFFTVYVFFQVWNQINCRSLGPEESGLYRLFENPVFLLIASLTVVGQVLIVTLGGDVFHVEPLDLEDWLAIAAGTASVLVFAEFARQIRLLRSAHVPNRLQ